MFRAARDLSASDPAFAAFLKKYRRSVGDFCVVAVASSEPGPLQKTVVQNADVKKAVEINLAQAKLFPDDPSLFVWAMLRSSEPAEADMQAEAIRKNPRILVEQSLDTLLSPVSGGEVLNTYWLMQVLGKPAEGRDAIRKIIGLGIPMPIEP
jgi:hypothetical protein